MTNYRNINDFFVEIRNNGTLSYVCAFLTLHPPQTEGEYRVMSEARFAPPAPETLSACLKDAVWARLEPEVFVAKHRSDPLPDDVVVSPVEAFDLPMRDHERLYPDVSDRFGLRALRQMLKNHTENEAGNHAYAYAQDRQCVVAARWKTAVIAALVMILNGGLLLNGLPDEVGWLMAGISLFGMGAVWFIHDRTAQRRNAAAARFRSVSEKEAMKVRHQHDAYLTALEILAREVRLMGQSYRADDWLVGRIADWPEHLRRAVRLEVWLEEVRQSLPNLMAYHRRQLRLVYNGLRGQEEFVRTHFDTQLTFRLSRYFAIGFMGVALTGWTGLLLRAVLTRPVPTAGGVAVGLLVVAGGYFLHRLWHTLTTLPPRFDAELPLGELRKTAGPSDMGDPLSHSLRREAVGQLMATTLPVSRMP